MLSLLVSLSVLGGAPRGLAVKDHADLVTQVDTRLPKWLVLGGDRKALLANKDELAVFAEPLAAVPADRQKIVVSLVTMQTEKPTVSTFVPVKALVIPLGGQTSISFFDSEGQRRCSVGLLLAKSGRLVLLGGPIVDDRSFGEEVEALKLIKEPASFFEKKNGAWTAAPIPTVAPPTCTEVLKKGAKALYVAEKANFAEFDSYSDHLWKLQVDTTSLGVGSVKVDVKGAGATASFSAELSLQGGVARVDDTGAITVVKPCTP